MLLFLVVAGVVLEHKLTSRKELKLLEEPLRTTVRSRFFR